MAQVGYQIVHSIAGRIRIRVPWLETDLQAASNYQRLVEALSGVKVVRINPLAQSIVVEYSPKAMSPAQAQELLISTMQQVKLTPPADAPTIEDQEDSEPAATDPSPEPDREPTPASTTPPSGSKQSIVSEIPSPWDEETLQPSETSKFMEENFFKTQTSPESSDPICSTASLAERLKVTSQAITRRRMKTDFGQWTQAQDPEGIAWNYHEHDRSFRPVSAKDPAPEIEL